MMNEIIPIIVDAIFAILGCVITAFGVPVIKKLMEKQWVKTAVQAAEKIYKDSGMGEKKYEYVVSFLQSIKVLKTDANGEVPEYWRVLIESSCEELELLAKKVKEEVTTENVTVEENKQ